MIEGMKIVLGVAFSTKIATLAVPIKDNYQTGVAVPSAAREMRRRGFLWSLDGFPVIVVMMILFASIATAGLWSYSSALVIENANPALPFTLSIIGYAGMGVSCLFIALKLTRSVLKLDVENDTDGGDDDV